jgi:hypothetical protein
MQPLIKASKVHFCDSDKGIDDDPYTYSRGTTLHPPRIKKQEGAKTGAPEAELSEASSGPPRFWVANSGPSIDSVSPFYPSVLERTAVLQGYVNEYLRRSRSNIDERLNSDLDELPMIIYSLERDTSVLIRVGDSNLIIDKDSIY